MILICIYAYIPKEWWGVCLLSVSVSVQVGFVNTQQVPLRLLSIALDADAWPWLFSVYTDLIDACQLCVSSGRGTRNIDSATRLQRR